MPKIKHKKIVKELRHPDQFVDFWTHAWQRLAAFMGPRQKPAIAAAVALSVVLVGASIINYLEGTRHVEASRKLMGIQQIAIADPLTDATDPKDVPVHKDDVPRFKTSEEREAAVVKEIDGFIGGSAAKELKSEALIMKGASLLALARYDDALGAYQAALDGHLDARLRFLAHEGRGYAYEGKGELDKALGAFGQLGADAKEFRGFYEDGAAYQKARMTEVKGDKVGAVGQYKQLLEKYPDTSFKDQITDRLALIEAK